VRTLVLFALLTSLRPVAAAALDGFEQRLMAVPDTASTRRMTYDLTRVPHVAGTPAQALTRDYVINKLRTWGLEAWTKEYTVYIPHPDSIAASVIPPPPPPRPRPIAPLRRSPCASHACPEIPPAPGDRSADAAMTERELADLATRVDQARGALDEATAALR
jgi:hypothetical protein